MDALFTASPVAMVVIGADGRILAANDAAFELFGRAAAELIGMDIASLAEASSVDVERRTRAVTYEGRPAEIIALHDVTHRRAVEIAARESLKMQALGRFAGTLGHDLNNIFSVILSYSDFLVTDLGPGHPSLADAEEVRRSGQRGTDLLRRLMVFCRPSGTHVAPTDIHAVLDQLREKLVERAGPRVEVVITRLATRPRAMFDPRAIEPTIDALVDNARDAMPEGGKLTITTLDATVDERESLLHGGARPGPHLVLRFVDGGVGMDERVRERAFEPFFTTKPRGKGIGLGLPLVFGFVSACGGHIRVSSEAGRGATVDLYLPVAQT